MNPKTIPAYLRKHADLPADEWTRPERAQHVIVVPMRGEGATIAPLLESLHQTHRKGTVLLIAVVNGSEGGLEAHHNANDETLALLRGNFSIPHAACAAGHSGDVQILLVDKASQQWRLAKKQGVGLARKIGCDLALLLQHEGCITSPWIHSSDADVRLPRDYFQATAPLDEQKNTAAVTYPFIHEPEGASDQQKAIRLYEVSLYYYVLGLQWAGSPYAYQTIGSTIAVRGWNYAAVRGFPKREAGEDFYLLNKVAKTGAITTPNSQPIAIRGRRSDRVPFGTGAAMNQMSHGGQALAEYPLYDPAVFSALQGVLGGLEAFAAHGTYAAFIDALATPTGLPHKEIMDVVTHMGFEEALVEAARQAPTEDALTYRLHAWFDSFRTLRFIHQVRDAALPSPSWREALERADFVRSKTREDLELLRNQIARESQALSTAGLVPHKR